MPRCEASGSTRHECEVGCEVGCEDLMPRRMGLQEHLCHLTRRNLTTRRNSYATTTVSTIVAIVVSATSPDCCSTVLTDGVGRSNLQYDSPIALEASGDDCRGVEQILGIGPTCSRCPDCPHGRLEKWACEGTQTAARVFIERIACAHADSKLQAAARREQHVTVASRLRGLDKGWSRCNGNTRVPRAVGVIRARGDLGLIVVVWRRRGR